MAGSKIRLKLKAYDHAVIDATCAKIVAVATNAGAKVTGPIPIPTEREVICILRSPHKYKDAREAFECRTHKRIIDVYNCSASVMDALMKLEMPAGVDVRVKV
ncbi:MAG: 30S ribosomal protein S10 [Christensenellaceae bacterium]|jgi:small subunit ribosomal protein S10|nr:30S ribosomal protein S10 [Christensenellaceae bacterium]